MRFVNAIRKFASVRNAAGTALAGLVIAAVCFAIVLLDPGKGYEPVTAVITDIRDVGTADEAETITTVRYTVNGKEYTAELTAYSSTWKVGGELTCKYDPADPASVVAAGDRLTAAICGAVGLAAMVFGILRTVSALRRSADDYSELDRVRTADATPEQLAAVRDNTEPVRDYVVHYTGKLNQDYVMKDADGCPVYEALCEKLRLFRDTAYDFRDLRTGETVRHAVGHTLTRTVGTGSETLFRFRVPINSGFRFDGTYIWDHLAALGYSADFSLRGLTCVFDVKHWGYHIGTVETAGTGTVNEKWKDNPLGKMPTGNIFRVSCQPSEIPAVFLLAFTLARIDLFGD